MKMNLVSTNNSPDNRRFGFWASLPLARKLFLAFGALFLLTVIVAVLTLWGSSRTQVAYDETIAQGIEMRRLSDQVELNLLRARRDGKDFLIRWQIEGYDQAYRNYVTPFKADVVAVREYIQQLAPFGPVAATLSTGDYSQEQYEADIATLTTDIAAYEQGFDAMVASIKTRGSDENTGLEGEMRIAAHEIEAQVSGKTGLEPLEITYLQMRRAEKDYIQRRQQSYIDDVKSLAAQLKTQVVETDQLESAVKALIGTRVDVYLKTFAKIVVADQEIDQHYNELAAAAVALSASSAKLNQLGKQLAADDINTAQRTATQTFTISILAVLMALGISILAALLLSRQITNPIRTLTHTAQEISDGNLELQAQVTSSDEVGTLAQTFNIMTARLSQAFADVNRRAGELATVAEVGTATATILETDRLLQEVVNLSKERFNLYHAHIYLLDESRENLVLTSGAGEVGRQMKAKGLSIPFNREQSLVARAAREQKGVTVNDVTLAPDFLPNPLLPNTRSELAVPMIVGGKVIGVFDVQSEQIGRFTESDVNIQITLAAQVATSIQNVRSFEQSKAQAELESLVNAIGQKIQRAATVEEVLQIAARELGTATGAARVSANLSRPAESGDVKLVSERGLFSDAPLGE
jgi:GAF domain-containing protein/HAMP domain-containing protein